METNIELNRETKFALMSAGAAGAVSMIMISTFISMLSWIFVPSVMIAVFISAYFGFKRKMRSGGVLDRSKIFRIASEVGTVSHLYTFAMYLPLNYLVIDIYSFNGDLVMSYVVVTFVMTFVSLISFVWIAVPMYMGIGYLQKSMENGIYDRQNLGDDTLLDDTLFSSE